MPTPAQIRSRRKASTVSSLRRKAKAGTKREDERAQVRLSKQATRVVTGEEDLTMWDDEELVRGMRKDKTGIFRGRPPVLVPKALHDEMVRRQMSRAMELLQDNLCAAVEVLVSIATRPTAEDKDRIVAAKLIIDRVLGKTPERVQLNLGDPPPWLKALTGGIVSVENEGDVIDVEEE